MRRKRATRHETEGDIAAFIFSPEVSDEFTPYRDDLWAELVQWRGVVRVQLSPHEFSRVAGKEHGHTYGIT